MTENKDVVSIKKYKKKPHLNIGVILFGVIFFYLIVMIILYFSKSKTAVYEVREGSILKDTTFTGIALREENVVYADKDGYVNYFFESGKKVATGKNVYVLTKDAILDDGAQESNDEVNLRTDNWSNLLQKVQGFNDSFSQNEFQTAQMLQEETSTILQNNTTQNRVAKLNELLSSEAGEGAATYTSTDDGIICYSVDGYETLKAGDVGDEELSKSNYTKVSLMNNIQVKSGDPVYRLVTSENWTLVIRLSNDMEKYFLDEMGDKGSKYVKLRFVKDEQTVWGNLKIYHSGADDAYGCISLSDSMIRYVDDRYLDVEVILEDESGLKIPKSAVTEKEFYAVPEDYLTGGGSTSSNGVLRQNSKKGTVEFVETDIFSRDIENGIVYLKKDQLQDGDILVKPESTETMTLSEKTVLQGVYNINKGYAVFTQVKILCESEEYYIIEEGSKYGLSNYDHIALDGSTVQENDIISQ